MNRAAPKCSVVDFVIPWTAGIIAGFRLKDSEETSDAGDHEYGDLVGSLPSRFDRRVESASGMSGKRNSLANAGKLLTHSEPPG